MVEKRNVCALIFLTLSVVFGLVALATREWSRSENLNIGLFSFRNSLPDNSTMEGVVISANYESLDTCPFVDTTPTNNDACDVLRGTAAFILAGMLTEAVVIVLVVIQFCQKDLWGPSIPAVMLAFAAAFNLVAVGLYAGEFHNKLPDELDVGLGVSWGMVIVAMVFDVISGCFV